MFLLEVALPGVSSPPSQPLGQTLKSNLPTIAIGALMTLLGGGALWKGVGSSLGIFSHVRWALAILGPLIAASGFMPASRGSVAPPPLQTGLPSTNRPIAIDDFERNHFIGELKELLVKLPAPGQISFFNMPGKTDQQYHREKILALITGQSLDFSNEEKETLKEALRNNPLKNLLGLLTEKDIPKQVRELAIDVASETLYGLNTDGSGRDAMMAMRECIKKGFLPCRAAFILVDSQYSSRRGTGAYKEEVNRFLANYFEKSRLSDSDKTALGGIIEALEDIKIIGTGNSENENDLKNTLQRIYNLHESSLGEPLRGSLEKAIETLTKKIDEAEENAGKKDPDLGLDLSKPGDNGLDLLGDSSASADEELSSDPEIDLSGSSPKGKPASGSKKAPLPDPSDIFGVDFEVPSLNDSSPSGAEEDIFDDDDFSPRPSLDSDSVVIEDPRGVEEDSALDDWEPPSLDDSSSGINLDSDSEVIEDPSEVEESEDPGEFKLSLEIEPEEIDSSLGKITDKINKKQRLDSQDEKILRDVISDLKDVEVNDENVQTVEKILSKLERIVKKDPSNKELKSAYERLNTKHTDWLYEN